MVEHTGHPHPIFILSNPQSGAATFIAASPSTPSYRGVAGFWGLAPIPQPALTTTYDVVTDFNATGIQPLAGDPFTYGTETSLNTGFTLFPHFHANGTVSVRRGQFTTDGTLANYYITQAISGPSVGEVATGGPLSFSGAFTIPNGVL